MKILWLCNTILPPVSKALAERISPYGGWMTGLLDTLSETEDIAVCFPYEKGNPTLKGTTKRFSFYGYKETENNIDVFSTIIEDYKPDLIHIWGTEYKHSLDMVCAAEKKGLLNRVLINIQGLVSLIGYHYYCGIPERVYKSASLAELIYRNNIEHDKLRFDEKGKYEIEALRKVNYVVGRTDWDEACIKQINPGIKYFRCNETLRESFYKNRWDVNKCQRHTIFVSQSHYPVKGFHLMLEAMPMILQRFPDAHLYTTGKEPQRPANLVQYLKHSSYPKYIRSLLDKYHLEEHVSFLGALQEQEMCERYLNSNVFVSPSSVENSSNSICEAMLLGMPVVSSCVGGIQNLMIHGKEGYIYQQDAPYMLAYYVCKIFEEKEMASEIGKHAHEHAVITHDRKKNEDDMIRIYGSVLHGV